MSSVIATSNEVKRKASVRERYIENRVDGSHTANYILGF